MFILSPSVLTVTHTHVNIDTVVKGVETCPSVSTDHFHYLVFAENHTERIGDMPNLTH